MNTYLNPVEAARAYGVTAKALRVYEAKGLLTPHRTAAGWRLYGPDEAARVYEILLLQGLGLSLAQVATLLRGRTSDLAVTLAAQQEALERRLTETRKAIRLIAKARGRLAADGMASGNVLGDLLREAASDMDWSDVIERFYARHLHRQDWADPSSVAAVKTAWPALLAELRRLVRTRTEPTSPKAQAFLRRWLAAATAITDDPDVHRDLHAAWKAAVSDPHAKGLPLGSKELDYLAALSASSSA